MTTGVPLGTALTVAAVPVQSGRATVDLTVRALSADAVLRRAIWAQFLATLLQVQLPPVQEISLRVDGAQLDLPGAGGVPVLAGRPRVPPGRHDGADGGRCCAPAAP